MKLANTHDIERSRPIPDFDGYRITNDGIVISCRRAGDPIVKKHEHRGSYAYVKLTNAQGEYENETVHSLVLITFTGPRPTPQHHTRHLNGNGLDNHISNLAWGLPIDNAADRRRHGRYTDTAPAGEQHTGAKLTETSVFRIVERLSAGDQQKQIATDFNVSPTTIGKIARGKRWKHLTECFRSHIQHHEHAEAA